MMFFLGLLFSLHPQAYNILDYGAVPDTTRLSTAAINNAIADCSKHGGGRVLIPAGHYKSGTIVFNDNVELYLDNGATLYASTDTADCPRRPQPATRSQKDQAGWYALLYAEGVQHIGIAGPGTIDGQGAKQIPRHTIPNSDLDGRLRNILFIACKDVLIEGVTLLNSGIWNQHYLDCEDLQIHRIRVYNHCNRNNDGLDLDGCRRVTVSDCIIDSDDDGIVLKSTGPAGCKDILITNCIVSSFTNAIKCGTESTGGFRNIAISNCVVQRSRSTIPPVFGRTDIGITGLSLEIVDGGTMEGISVTNLVIEETECPIYVRLGNRARKYSPGAPAPRMGIMRNIDISHITASHTGNYGSSITGVPGGYIENISLSHIRLTNKGAPGEYIPDAGKVIEDEKGYPEPTVWKELPSKGLFIRHVRGLDLDHISISSENPDPRPDILKVDVQ
ncbi:MAG TPA: glycosyl hydrolase family 28 protein [Puia sp.]